jgi:gliding motility-associated-like protein
MIQSSQPCSQVDTIYIAPINFLSASATVSSEMVFAGETVTFSSNAVHFASLYFDFGDGTDTSGIAQVQHIYPTAGTYSAFFVASNGGCSDTVFFTIVVSGTSSLLVPNVFTPNGDDVNDLFMPSAFGMRALECTIMNRYGEVVHSWIGVRGYWDGYTFPAGLPCPEGTYFYWIRAEGLDGKPYNENGTISLLR